MSDSPATSDKGGARIMEMIRPAVLSMDKLSPAVQAKQASTIEPSPASTLGDSATDSSHPATPKDGQVHDLTSSMRDLLVDNVNASSEAKLVHGSTCLMLDDHGSQGLVSDSSPSKPAKDEIVDCSSPINSSSSANRLDAVNKSSAWGDSENNDFVRSSGTKEDPFLADSPKTPSSAKEHTIAMYRVREDRAGDLPTPGTAQAHFDPDACVFVANLLQTATDQQLEHAVTVGFSQFGKVYVKIRRDSRGMPFAFAQYETEDEAQHAVTEGRNMPILGRHCRTEIARVNRTLYLSRIAGGEVTYEEARDLLQGYGAIEELHYASSAERALYGLPQGIFVRFHFYDDCRDAQIKFRIHDSYRLEQARVPEDMRIAPRRQGPVSGAGFPNATPPRYSPRSPTNVRVRYDDRSIFVGNLPISANEQGVREHFGRFGLIFNVVLCVKQTSMDPVNLNVFGFVEYSTRGEADAAVQQAPRMFEGFHLRVEHKVSRRLLMNQAGSPNGSNQMSTGHLPAQAHDMMMMFYQRGVEMGVNQATQAQTLTSPVMLPQVYTSYPQSYYHHYEHATEMYGGSNGTSPTYGHHGLGLSSYGNPSIASGIGQPRYTQATAAVQYGQHEQANGYTNSATSRSGETAYVWPNPAGNNGTSSSSTAH